MREETESSNPAADAAMARYALGEEEAFLELYRAIRSPLFSYVSRKVRDEARAEDIVQQTMLQVHCARGRFVPGSRATPWILSIATHLFLDQVRRKKLELLSADGDGTREHPSQWPNPEACIASKQLEAVVRAALERLSPPQREAFELVHYAHMTQSEVAESLGVTVASVKLRMQRARQATREAVRSASELPQ